jgi:hypothetical protein
MLWLKFYFDKFDVAAVVSYLKPIVAFLLISWTAVRL